MTQTVTSEDAAAVSLGAAAPSEISDWLRTKAHADGVSVTRFERLQGGAVQDNWSLDVDFTGGPLHGAQRLVLRTDAPSGVASSLSRAQEFAVLSVVHDAGVIAPKPMFLCCDPNVIGRTFFIMERVPGISAGHRLTRDAALVPDRDALGASLGANLAHIHSIRPPRTALADLTPASANHALEAIAEYRAYLDSVEDSYPALEWGLRWCEVHAPAASETTLIHRDYRTGNYLVEGGRLTSVLDWEFAGWGDPREDMGWFTARCWRFGANDREAGGISGLDAFLDGYQSVAGHRVTRAELDYWQTMAHLRWAIIALQQAQRHVTGGQRSLELALTGRIVHELEYEMLQLIARRDA